MKNKKMGKPVYGNVDGETILCPLWKSFNSHEIRCESHVPDSSSVVLKYRDEKACEQQRKIFCEGCFKRCEQYRTVMHFNWPEE